MTQPAFPLRRTILPSSGRQSYSRHQRIWPVLALVLLLGSCGDGALAPDPPPDPPPQEPDLGLFDATMSQFMADRGIEAGLLGVMRHGVVVYQRGFGWQDSQRTHALPDTAIMRLASVSKPITAAAIRDLAAEGALDLDDHVFDLGQPGGGILTLDPFPALGDERLADVTVRHLIQHQGGWDRAASGDLTYQEIAIAAAMDLESPPGRHETARFILGQPLDFEPGGRDAYSNVGYLMLGMVIEEVSGSPYIDFVHQAIFEPLGVGRSAVIAGRTFPADRDPREPWYEATSTGPNVFDPSGPDVPRPDGGWHHEARIAQGGLVASTEAILEFLDAYQVAGEGIGTPRSGSEPSAWRWNHTGSFDGTSALARQRGDGINYVVLFNKRSPGGGNYAIEIRDELDHVIESGMITWP